MSDNTRDAIDRVAKNMRDHAAKNGVQMTQSETRKLVERARERGDRKRESNR